MRRLILLVLLAAPQLWCQFQPDSSLYVKQIYVGWRTVMVNSGRGFSYQPNVRIGTVLNLPFWTGSLHASFRYDNVTSQEGQAKANFYFQKSFGKFFVRAGHLPKPMGVNFKPNPISADGHTSFYAQELINSVVNGAFLGYGTGKLELMAGGFSREKGNLELNSTFKLSLSDSVKFCIGGFRDIDKFSDYGGAIGLETRKLEGMLYISQHDQAEIVAGFLSYKLPNNQSVMLDVAYEDGKYTQGELGFLRGYSDQVMMGSYGLNLNGLVGVIYKFYPAETFKLLTLLYL